MTGPDTCVMIRAYDRMDDLCVCVDAIRRHWTSGAYRILVVSNGAAAGFRIPAAIRDRIDHALELPENAGHILGSSQLLQAGIAALPGDCEWTVLLEADTWVFSDLAVRRAMSRLRLREAVWASSEWIERYWSLGLDLAVARTAFLRSNADIFAFAKHAECAVCNRLRERGAGFSYVREAMPVHMPKVMKTFRKRYGGRFRSFPDAQMVTHHVEDLPNGIESKKVMANICLGRNEFATEHTVDISNEHRRLRTVMTLARWLPRSAWFRGKRRMDV